MKTHQEIRDEIEVLTHSESLEMLAILHALNDRIEALDKEREKDFAATHDRITRQSASENNIPFGNFPIANLPTDG